MARPRRVTEAIAAASGAILMLLGGYVGLGEALTLVRGQWNVYGFFLGLMMTSALADQAGVFEVLTHQVARWARESALRLDSGRLCSGDAAAPVSLAFPVCLYLHCRYGVISSASQ